MKCFVTRTDRKKTTFETGMPNSCHLNKMYLFFADALLTPGSPAHQAIFLTFPTHAVVYLK
jgi:hypothetical protein